MASATDTVPEYKFSRAEAIAALTATDQPYAIHSIEQFGQEVRAFTNAPATLKDLYESTLSDATFLVYEDERYSFNQAYQRAAQIAHLLVDDYGVAVGDRVAISMRNYPEWIFAFMAVTSIGGVAVCMNALWQPDELEYGLTDSGAKVLLADAERVARFDQCSADLPVECVAVRPSQPGRHAALDDLLARKFGTKQP